MSGKKLYEVINEALWRLNSEEMEDNSGLYTAGDIFQNYTCDDIMKMLTDHKGDKGATWISLKNKNGKEIYFAEYVLGWGLL